MAGNANSGRRRQSFITDALTVEMKARALEHEGNKRGVRKLAEVVWDLAESGEKWAIEYVRDTIDGKPVQAIDHSGHIDTNLSQATDAELEAIALARPQHEGKTIN